MLNNDHYLNFWKLNSEEKGSKGNRLILSPSVCRESGYIVAPHNIAFFPFFTSWKIFPSFYLYVFPFSFYHNRDFHTEVEFPAISSNGGGGGRFSSNCKCLKDLHTEQHNKNLNLGHLYQKEDLETHCTKSYTVRIKALTVQ